MLTNTTQNSANPQSLTHRRHPLAASSVKGSAPLCLSLTMHLNTDDGGERNTAGSKRTTVVSRARKGRNGSVMYLSYLE
ncbi:hypothetical protein A2U01_0004655 [Trifolium medium]|uniref:Uncharacterized protein n=1 Tax=Trifolium medium TaxID=97028 RepID=A0A392M9E9_9FABA|nr:hypothetical protein [Trifolium medium]